MNFSFSLQILLNCICPPPPPLMIFRTYVYYTCTSATLFTFCGTVYYTILSFIFVVSRTVEMAIKPSLMNALYPSHAQKSHGMASLPSGSGEPSGSQSSVNQSDGKPTN